jgi:hypothetical protein
MHAAGGGLVDDARREVGILRLKVELAKCLLVLVEILPQDIPESLGLLWAEKDALVVLNAQLVGTLGVGLAKDKMEIPHADADLDAVGIGVAVSVGLLHVDARLLRVLAHSLSRLLRQGAGKRLALEPANEKEFPDMQGGRFIG